MNLCDFYSSVLVFYALNIHVHVHTCTLRSLFLAGITNLAILANNIKFANNSTCKNKFRKRNFRIFGEKNLNQLEHMSKSIVRLATCTGTM